jgi:hypothetical protein
LPKSAAGSLVAYGNLNCLLILSDSEAIILKTEFYILPLSPFVILPFFYIV